MNVASRTEQIETLTGKGRLRLSNRYAMVDYVIRVSQEFVGTTPTLKSATGGLNLPHNDVLFAMMDQKPLDLELHDGRNASILFTAANGNFTVTGPID